MKKLLIIVLIVGFAFNVSGQDSADNPFTVIGQLYMELNRQAKVIAAQKLQIEELLKEITVLKSLVPEK